MLSLFNIFNKPDTYQNTYVAKYRLVNHIFLYNAVYDDKNQLITVKYFNTSRELSDNNNIHDFLSNKNNYLNYTENYINSKDYTHRCDLFYAKIKKYLEENNLYDKYKLTYKRESFCNPKVVNNVMDWYNIDYNLWIKLENK